MRKTVLTCLAAVAALALPAADSGSCLTLSDPAGDSAYLRNQGAPFPSSSGTESVDLVGVAASATTDAVTVTFTLAGTPGPLPGVDDNFAFELVRPHGTYLIEAHLSYGELHCPDSAPYYVSAEIDDVDADGTGVTHYETTAVTGSVDYAARTVTVTAPAAVLGGLTAGDEWTVDEIKSNRGAMSMSAINTDSLSVPHTLVVGTRCR